MKATPKSMHSFSFAMIPASVLTSFTSTMTLSVHSALSCLVPIVSKTLLLEKSLLWHIFTQQTAVQSGVMVFCLTNWKDPWSRDFVFFRECHMCMSYVLLYRSLHDEILLTLVEGTNGWLFKIIIHLKELLTQRREQITCN